MSVSAHTCMTVEGGRTQGSSERSDSNCEEQRNAAILAENNALKMPEEPLGPQPIILENKVLLNPVRAGFEQFVVQPHLQFVTLSS